MDRNSQVNGQQNRTAKKLPKIDKDTNLIKKSKFDLLLLPPLLLLLFQLTFPEYIAWCVLLSRTNSIIRPAKFNVKSVEKSINNSDSINLKVRTNWTQVALFYWILRILQHVCVHTHILNRHKKNQVRNRVEIRFHQIRPPKHNKMTSRTHYVVNYLIYFFLLSLSLSVLCPFHSIAVFRCVFSMAEAVT